MTDHHPTHHPLSRRDFLKGAAAVPLAVYLAACTSGGPGPKGSSLVSPSTSPVIVPTPPTRLPDVAEAIVKATPPQVLERVYQGYFPGMSGDVVTVPIGYNYFDGGISHSTAWPYTQHVPMVWYGPGIVPKRGPITRQVTSADQAPTLAALTGFTDFQAPDGVVMDEVIDPAAPKPKLIVTLVWDAGGMYVLGLWPKNWPNLRKLMNEGVSYVNATVGSAPSSTAPVHATMGTGAFPRRHGILDNVQRYADGHIGDPWTPGPQSMLVPTFADHYGAAMQDKAEIGVFATLNWHLGMMGTSTAFDGGKNMLAVLREKGGGEGAEGIAWGLSDTTSEFYRFPDYVNDFPDITTYWPVADAADGVSDGMWRGHKMEDVKSGFDSPARIPYQTRALQEVMTREGLGHHDGIDLMFINYKLIDEVGHLFTASSQEMGDCVLAQDAALPGFIDFLDQQVGKGQWVLLITADHGHSANKDVTGAFPIKVAAVEQHLAKTFKSTGKDPVVERVRPGWSFVDLAQMEAANVTLDQISQDLRGLTETESSLKPDEISAGDADNDVLLTSFPGTWLPGMRDLAGRS
ncbi:MAG TPA: alkaline phosphatase family protein [Actinomycetota bacterium]|nr:alkaline phosphatase family protein [Actinomycetota bacterium]